MAIQTVETPAEAEARIRALKEEQIADQEMRRNFPTRPIPTDPNPGTDLNRPPTSAMDYPATSPNVMATEALDFADRSPLGVAAAERRKGDEARAKEGEVNLSPEFSGMDSKGKKSLPTAADRIREMNMPSASEQPMGGLRSDGMVNFKAPSGTKMVGQVGTITPAKPPAGGPTAQESVQQQLAELTPRELEFANAQKQPAFDEDGGQLPASQAKADPNAPEGTLYDHLQNYDKPESASWRHYLNALESGVGSTYGQEVKDEEGNKTYVATKAGYQEFVNDMTGGDETAFAEEQFIPQTTRGAADPENSGATKSGAVRGEKVDRAQEIAKERGARADDVTEGGEKKFTAEDLFEQEAGKDKTGKKRTWENATPAEKAKYQAMAVAYNENAGELRDESFAYRAHQMGKDNTDQASANQDVRNLDRMTAKTDEDRAKAEARFKGKSGKDAENIANDRGDHIIGGMGGGYENRLNPNTGEYEMQKTQDREDLTHQRRIRQLLDTERKNHPEQFMNRDGTMNEAAVQEWWEAHGGTDKVPGLETTGEVDADGNPIKTEAANIAASPYGSLGMDTKSRFEHRMKDMAQRKARVQDRALGYSPAGAKYNADIQDMINNGEWQQAAALAGRVGDEKTLEYLTQKTLSENKVLEAAAGNTGGRKTGGDGGPDPNGGTGNYATNAVIGTIASGANPMSPQVQALLAESLTEDLKGFNAEMEQQGYQPGSSQYESARANAILKHPAFNRLMNTMFTQADPQPYEEGIMDTVKQFFGAEPSKEAFTNNRLAMTKFVAQIMGAIGVEPGPHTEVLSMDIAKRYLNRMADRDENMGALRDQWNAEHPDDEWRGQGFLAARPKSGEQKGAEVAAAQPAAAEQPAPPAAEQEQGSNEDWHKKPTTSGETIDKKRAAEIMNSKPSKSGGQSVDSIRARIKERNASKPGSPRRSSNEKKESESMIPTRHPNPSLWE